VKPADVCIAVLVAVITVVGGAAVTLLSRRSQVSEKQVLPKIA
jgi:hypothetical protein